MEEILMKEVTVEDVTLDLQKKGGNRKARYTAYIQCMRKQGMKTRLEAYAKKEKGEQK